MQQWTVCDNLQDKRVRESDVGRGAIDRRDKRRVEHFGAHFGQAEHGEAPVVAPVLKVVRLFPHERQAQVAQAEPGRSAAVKTRRLLIDLSIFLLYYL